VTVEGGYVKEVSEDFLRRQKELIAEHVRAADIVITTALIPGKKAPVLIATHSNRFLDALSDPAASIVLCELDKNKAARIWRPSPLGLDSWIEEYKGMGNIRAAGYESHVFGKDGVLHPLAKKE